jgi:hypothetical protein
VAYAVPNDVQTRLGRPLTEDEQAQVAALLTDVEILIKSRVPDLDDQVTDGKIAEEVIIMIESNAVVRLIRNPNGYTSETDGSYSYQISYSLASGSLDILDQEWSLLGVSDSIFMINLKVRTPFESRALSLDPGSTEYAVWAMNADQFWNPL